MSNAFVHDWITGRQAAHLAAFQEVQRLPKGKLIKLLYAMAEDFRERAVEVDDHDEALGDLVNEALCLRVALILKHGKKKKIKK